MLQTYNLKTAIPNLIKKTMTKQIGGTHYLLKIQPIEYISKNKLQFSQGNVIKYISRYKSKNGIEDLKKAKHYIDFIVNYEYLGKVIRFPAPSPDLVIMPHEYSNQNGFSFYQMHIIEKVTNHNRGGGLLALRQAQKIIDILIFEYE